MTRQAWQDVVTSRPMATAAAESSEACAKRHRTPEAAYVCGAGRLRSLAHVGRDGRPRQAFALLALEVRPMPAGGAR